MNFWRVLCIYSAAVVLWPAACGHATMREFDGLAIFGAGSPGSGQDVQDIEGHWHLLAQEPLLVIPRDLIQRVVVTELLLDDPTIEMCIPIYSLEVYVHDSVNLKITSLVARSPGMQVTFVHKERVLGSMFLGKHLAYRLFLGAVDSFAEARRRANEICDEVVLSVDERWLAEE